MIKIAQAHSLQAFDLQDILQRFSRGIGESVFLTPEGNSANSIYEVLGVQSVRQVRVRKDSITIEVEFQGDRYRFLDSVLNHENLPFPLNLAETQEGNILLKLESGGW